MLEDLSPAQRQLAEFMSDLSEEAYYAGWVVGLEYALWEVVLDGRSEYGQLELTDEHRARLRQLSEACAGWITFDEQTGERWVAISEWRAHFATWQSTRDQGTDG
jgi:hypothetical protein